MNFWAAQTVSSPAGGVGGLMAIEKRGADYSRCCPSIFQPVPVLAMPSYRRCCGTVRGLDRETAVAQESTALRHSRCVETPAAGWVFSPPTELHGIKAVRMAPFNVQVAVRDCNSNSRDTANPVVILFVSAWRNVKTHKRTYYGVLSNLGLQTSGSCNSPKVVPEQLSTRLRSRPFAGSNPVTLTIHFPCRCSFSIAIQHCGVRPWDASQAARINQPTHD